KEGLDALAEASDREEDIMDKAFDVKSNSRLGCQSKILRDVTVVVEISRESRQAFLDEHPEIRNALKQGAAPPPRRPGSLGLPAIDGEAPHAARRAVVAAQEGHHRRILVDPELAVVAVDDERGR